MASDAQLVAPADRLSGLRDERAQADALYDVHTREEFSEPKTTELVNRLFDLNNHAMTAVLEGADPELVANAVTAGALAPNVGRTITLTNKEREEVYEAIEAVAEWEVERLQSDMNDKRQAQLVTDWLAIASGDLAYNAEETSEISVTDGLRRYLPHAAHFVKSRIDSSPNDPEYREQFAILERVCAEAGVDGGEVQ